MLIITPLSLKVNRNWIRHFQTEQYYLRENPPTGEVSEILKKITRQAEFGNANAVS